MPTNLKLTNSLKNTDTKTTACCLYRTSNIFFPTIIKKEQAINCPINISIHMIPYTIIIKKEQAINLSYKYFNSCDPLYYNNKKGTNNNFFL